MRYPYKDRPYYIHKTHAALVTQRKPRGAGGAPAVSARRAQLYSTTQAEGAARFVSSALAYRTERVSYQMSDILYRKQPFFLYIEN